MQWTATLTLVHLDFAWVSKNGTSSASPGPKTLLERSAHVKRPSILLACRMDASTWAFRSLRISLYCSMAPYHYKSIGAIANYKGSKSSKRYTPSKGMVSIHLHHICHVNHQKQHQQNCRISAVWLCILGKHKWYFSHLKKRDMKYTMKRDILSPLKSIRAERTFSVENWCDLISEIIFLTLNCVHVGGVKILIIWPVNIQIKDGTWAINYCTNIFTQNESNEQPKILPRVPILYQN